MIYLILLRFRLSYQGPIINASFYFNEGYLIKDFAFSNIYLFKWINKVHFHLIFYCIKNHTNFSDRQSLNQFLTFDRGLDIFLFHLKSLDLKFGYYRIGFVAFVVYF